ncbi:MAG: hypothetical protein OEX04_11990 [Acidimicrobiia bacterium]|nr:hypothetical protein [Acidimicrobiia bacterium]MDH5292207.1 hypothetical protein [Acidimicrobiia bacterium]
MRRLSILAAVIVVGAACGGGETGGGTEPPAVPAMSTTTMVTTTVPPSTTAPSTTSTTSSSTTTTLPPIGEIAPGLLCRDLKSMGYSYVDAVAYWTREGRPPRMDADANAIPCETVYPSSDVKAFWGEPLPTSTTLPAVTLGTIAGELGREVGGTWTCALAHGSSLRLGAVVKCVPDPMVHEGEYPVYTGLVLDSAGKTTFAQSGLLRTILNVEFVFDYLDRGQYCRDILAEGSALEVNGEITSPALQYFGAVLYWFMEDLPDRMDADLDGRPCETLVASSVERMVWGGGLIEG